MTAFNAQICDTYRGKVDKLETKIYGNGENGLAVEVKLNTDFRKSFKKVITGVLIILIAGIISQTIYLTYQIQNIKIDKLVQQK